MHVLMLLHFYTSFNGDNIITSLNVGMLSEIFIIQFVIEFQKHTWQISLEL